MELILLLIILLFVLAVIMVAGHVMWLIVAAAFRWVFKSTDVVEPRDDLAATERQLTRFYTEGKISDDVYNQLMARIRGERTTDSTNVTRVVEKIVVESVSSVLVEPKVEPPQKASPPPPAEPPPPPRAPRRPFSEVLNSFMEESNIRWGEIIGGLLIIGCSTALVVGLWAQISQIPVLKFLIFT